MTWQVVTGANLVIAAAYLAICTLVLSGLARSGQLTSNRLGVATGVIFLACSLHRGWLAGQMLLPAAGIESPAATALRAAWQWPTVALDLFAAVVAIYYLAHRGAHLLGTAGMFEDLRARERQALEINDNIVQGLARVKWALEARLPQEAHAAADRTLAEAQKMVTDLLMAQSPDGALQAGRLRRETPAGAITDSA